MPGGMDGSFGAGVASRYFEWFSERAAGPLLAGLTIAWLASYLLTRHNEHFKTRREHVSKAVDSLRTQLEALLEVCGTYWGAQDAQNFDKMEAEIEYLLADINTLSLACLGSVWRSSADAAPQMVAKLIIAAAPEPRVGKLPTPDHRRIMQVGQAASALSQAALMGRAAYFDTSANAAPHNKADVGIIALERALGLIAITPAFVFLSVIALYYFPPIPLAAGLAVGILVAMGLHGFRVVPAVLSDSLQLGALIVLVFARDIPSFGAGDYGLLAGLGFTSLLIAQFQRARDALLRTI